MFLDDWSLGELSGARVIRYITAGVRYALSTRQGARRPRAEFARAAACPRRCARARSILFSACAGAFARRPRPRE